MPADTLDRDALAVPAGYQQQEVGERGAIRFGAEVACGKFIAAPARAGRRAVRACASRWFTAI